MSIPDLTQRNKFKKKEIQEEKQISIPQTSGMLNIKKRAEEKRAAETEKRSKKVVEQARKKKLGSSPKAKSLAPYIDFLPLDGGIVISKLDFELEEETEDVYIFKKVDLKKQKKVEKKTFDVRKHLQERQQRLD